MKKRVKDIIKIDHSHSKLMHGSLEFVDFDGVLTKTKKFVSHPCA